MHRMLHKCWSIKGEIRTYFFHLDINKIQ